MPRLLFLLLVVVATRTATFCAASNEQPTLNVIAYWNKGDRFNVKTTYHAEKGIPNQKLEFNSELYAEIVVLDFTKDSYTIQWTYTKTNIAPNDNSVDNQLKRSIKNLKFVYKISDAGAFISLLNYEELKSKVNQAFDTLLLTLGGTQTQVQLKQSRQSILTPLGIQTVLMKDIMVFHFVLGKQYETDKAQEGAIKIPSMFGGEPYSAIERVEIPVVNKQSNIGIIKTSKRVNDPKLISDIKGFLKSAASDNNESTIGDIKSSDVDFTEATYHEVNLSKGLPLKSVLTRNLSEKTTRFKNFSEITAQIVQ